MVDRGNGILPKQLLFGNLRAEIAREGTHVPVRQLEPRPGEGVCELFRVFLEASGDRPVDGVHPKRQVCRGHDGRVPFRRIVCVGHEIGRGRIGGNPLPGAGRALHQIPVVAEQGVRDSCCPTPPVWGSMRLRCRW